MQAMLVKATVTKGSKGVSVRPALCIETPWCAEGFFGLTWRPTPAELRCLADSLESCIDAYERASAEAATNA